MNNELEKLFTELQRQADRIFSFEDNEAIRHDLLIRPILTHPMALGWEQGETLSQVETGVPVEVSKSYYWRSATPRKRRPDIILLPYNVGQALGGT